MMTMHHAPCNVQGAAHCAKEGWVAAPHAVQTEWVNLLGCPCTVDALLSLAYMHMLLWIVLYHAP